MPMGMPQRVAVLQNLPVVLQRADCSASVFYDDPRIAESCDSGIFLWWNFHEAEERNGLFLLFADDGHGIAVGEETVILFYCFLIESEQFFAPAEGGDQKEQG